MPQENMSKRIGTSSSPSIAKVIANNKNVQQPVTSTKTAFNKKPVKS